MDLSITLQWIPRHCWIFGQEIADRTAARTRTSLSLVFAPFATADVCEQHWLNWEDPFSWHHVRSKLFLVLSYTNCISICKFRPSRDLPRWLQSLFHKLQVKVSCTPGYLHRTSGTATPEWYVLCLGTSTRFFMTSLCMKMSVSFWLGALQRTTSAGSWYNDYFVLGNARRLSSVQQIHLCHPCALRALWHFLNMLCVLYFILTTGCNLKSANRVNFGIILLLLFLPSAFFVLSFILSLGSPIPNPTE